MINNLRLTTYDLRLKKILLITILFFTTTSLFSQEKLSFASVDKQTYDQYLQKDWKNLIKLGKQAEKLEIDFYYLQYRMGIAYYELKNYRKAIPYFKKVLIQYPNDEIGLEYLYYSYLRSNMFEDARKLWLTFEGDLKKKNSYYNDKIILNGLGLEYKYNIVDNYQVEVLTDETLNQKIVQSLNYFNVNMKHYSNGNFTLFHALSYLTSKKTVFDSEYTLDPFIAFDENVKQIQYYALGNINISEGTNLKFGFHYLHGKIVATGTKYVATGGWGGGTGGYYVNTTYYSLNVSNFVGFAAYQKSFSNFDIKLASSVSNINEGFQIQPSLSATYYPLGNSNFYWQTEAFYQYSSFEGQSNGEFILKQKLGVSIAKKFHLEPFAMYGNAKSFVDNNAYTIYNGLDKINYWYGVNLSIKLGKHTHFYAIYQKYNYTNEYQVNENDFNIDYNSQTILGGLVWNF